MRKYWCDGCGRELERDEVAIFYEIDLDNNSLDETGELCPECRVKVKEFVDELREKRRRT